MKEHPILFNEAMIRAILDDRKTQTRRPVKPQPRGVIENSGGEWVDEYHNNGWRCPFGYPGDRLWVRETFWVTRNKHPRSVIYRADGDDGFSWRPSIHMPRWASRLTLEVTDVRVERVQDINSDCIADEGYASDCGCTYCAENEDYCEEARGALVDSFADSWDSIYAKKGYGWDSNPWIWAIEFKRVDQ